VGISVDANFAGHGFVRAANGTFIGFDPSGSTFTFPISINPQGAISGFYTDVSGVTHGFLRTPEGTITMFDAPGAVTTAAAGINPAGAVVGSFFDANFVLHGFLRAPDGTITAFDAPGSTSAFGTEPVAINPAGVITGFYSGADMFHGLATAPSLPSIHPAPHQRPPSPSIRPGLL
jgi:uncharacterized membrane protein